MVDVVRSPQQIADGVGVGMLARDRATITMTVRDDMLNGLDTCHGGLIATLADSAFAFACNSHGAPTVAAGFTIDFVAPGRAGDVLTARCAEVAKAGRNGVYDVEVTNQRGERIAVFRGRSHTLRNGATGP